MRLVNRLLAALLSLALIIIGGLLITEVIADRIHHRPILVKWHSSYHWAQHTSWVQGSVRVTCVVLVLLGLVLLYAELKRPRVTRLVVRSDGAENIDAAYTRRGVAAALQTAVTDVDGVRRARVTVTHRKVRVVAATSARDSASARELLEPARTAASARIDALELKRTPRLKISTTARKS